MAPVEPEVQVAPAVLEAQVEPVAPEVQEVLPVPAVLEAPGEQPAGPAVPVALEAAAHTLRLAPEPRRCRASPSCTP